MFLFNERKGFIPVSRNFGAVKVCMFIKDNEFIYDTYSVEKFLSNRLGFKVDLSKYIKESCEDFRTFTNNDFVRDIEDCPRLPRMSSFEIDKNYFVSRTYPAVDENCLFRIFVSLLFDIVPELDHDEADKIESIVELARKDITRMEEDLSFLINKINEVENRKNMLKLDVPSKDEVAVDKDEKDIKKNTKSGSNKKKKTSSKKKVSTTKTKKNNDVKKHKEKPLFEVITDKEMLKAKEVPKEFYDISDNNIKVKKDKTKSKVVDITNKSPIVLDCTFIEEDSIKSYNNKESIHKNKDDCYEYDYYDRPLMFCMDNPSFIIPDR